MILEVATFFIRPGQETAFETALDAALGVFSRARGFRGLRLNRCIETPTEYQAHILWDRLEDHTVGFRESALFQEWRALVGPHFAAPPQVAHYDIGPDRAPV